MAPNDQVSIDQSTPTPDQGVSIDLNATAPMLSPVTADKRATVARYGLSGVMPDKSKDSWYTDILSGKEDEARKEAASTLDNISQNTRLQAVSEGKPIPEFRPTDPTTIFETSFASKYTQPVTDPNNLNTAKSFVTQAQQEIPEIVQQAEAVTHNSVAITQYIKTQLGNLEGRTQGLSSQIGSGMLGLIPFAQSAAMRLPALHSQGFGAAFSGLLDQNLLDQSSNLYRQSLPEAKSQINAVVQGLGPALASQWLQAMKGQSSDDIFNNKMYDIIDLSGVVGPAAALARDTIGAFKSVAKSASIAGEVRPIEVESAAARGDLAESAIQTIKKTAENPTVPPDPEKQAINSLFSAFRTDMNDIKAGPGSYGQDIVNRIETSNNNFLAELENKVTNVQRVNRTPREIALEDVVRDEKARIEGQFRGVANTLVEISGPHYDEVSPFGAGKLTNSYYYEVKLGDYDGNLFPNRKQAELFAEMNKLVTEHVPYGHEPLTGMSMAPIEYKNFTEFRAAARKAGIKDKDLKAAKVNSSMSFEGAKKSQTASGGYQIKQQGQGFYVSIPKPVVENTPHMIAALGTPTATEVPYIWSNSAFSWARSPVDTLSEAEVGERRVAAHGPQALHPLAAMEYEVMKDIPSQHYDRFNDILRQAQDLYDPVTGDKGYFYTSPQDVEDWYQLFYQTRPTAQEIEGYFAFKRLANYDLGMRNILMYRNMSIRGAEQHRIYATDKNGDKQYSDYFPAIKHTEDFPNGPDNILILGDKMGDEKVMPARDFVNTKEGIAAKEQFSKGETQVSRIYAPEHRPLSGWGNKVKNNRIRYILGRNINSKPLDVGNMIPQRGGGHVMYEDSPLWLKQADVRHDVASNTLIYEGDRTIMPMRSPGEAKDIMDKMNAVRQYMQADMHDEARNLMRTTLPIPEDKHFGWYFETKLPTGERVSPFLRMDTPIKTVPNNRMIIDMDRSLEESYKGLDFRDGTKSGSDNRIFQLEFTGQRDAEELFTIHAKGSKSNPLYEFQPASKVDPITASGRAINRVVNSFFNDDMKLMSQTHWLKDAIPHFKVSPEEVWHAPWWYFNQDPTGLWKSGADATITRQLEANRFKIQQFSGVQNKLQTFLHTVDSKIAESLYQSMGPRAAIVPTHLIPMLNDPFRIVRSMVVHRSLGLFNLPSMFVQGMTSGNVVAIAGAKHGMPGLLAATLDRWTRFNRSPEFMQYLDNIMSQMGWRPGEFIEANKNMAETGFQPVGTEHGFIADPTRARTIVSKGQTFLDWGMLPFTEGAEFTRTTAFYTAHHEFRHGGGGSLPGRKPFTMGTRRWNDNPFGKIEREDVADILNRAGTLDHNMSRVANSTWQSGIGSVPALFISYRLRLTELLFGRVLNPMEKARLMGYSALLYGIPMGPLGLLGAPIGDYLRQYAISHGYQVGNSFITSMAMEGIPATGLAWITGALSDNKTIAGELTDKTTNLLQSAKHLEPIPNILPWMYEKYKQIEKTAQKGNWYNLGERYGNEGLMGDLNSNNGLAGWLGGAPLGAISDAAQRLGPIWNDMIHPYTHPPTFSDINEAIKILNGYSNFDRTLGALETHQWMSKNGTVLSPTDMSVANSIFQGVTGMSDARTAQAYVTNNMLKNAKDNRETALSAATIEWHHYLTARQNNDDSNAEKFRSRAEAIYQQGGNPLEKWNKFVLDANNSFGKNIVNMNAERFYEKEAPDTKKPEYNEIYKEMLRQQDKRGELK